MYNSRETLIAETIRTMSKPTFTYLNMPTTIIKKNKAKGKSGSNGDFYMM